jgi:hypothetical protein
MAQTLKQNDDMKEESTELHNEQTTPVAGVWHPSLMNVYDYMQCLFPFCDDSSALEAGMVPVVFETDGLSEEPDHNRRRKRGGKDIPHALAVCGTQIFPTFNDFWRAHKRRRAQNRLSQRAFRHRKEERQKELEEKLSELQQVHIELIQSYEILQQEYLQMKREVETLQREISKHGVVMSENESSFSNLPSLESESHASGLTEFESSFIYEI